jgi:hypothetical protein
MSTVEHRPADPEQLTRADVLGDRGERPARKPAIDALRPGASPGASGAPDRPALDLQKIPAQPSNSASIRGGHVVTTVGLEPDD